MEASGNQAHRRVLYEAFPGGERCLLAWDVATMVYGGFRGPWSPNSVVESEFHKQTVQVPCSRLNSSRHAQRLCQAPASSPWGQLRAK